MAFTPFIEFGFSEITEFELGREAGALLSLTEFDSVGEASASFTSLSIVSTKANSSGSSLALFDGAGTANTYMIPPSSGKGTAIFISGYAINTSLGVLSQSSAHFDSGYAAPTEFFSAGTSEANFYVTEGNEFFASGTSKAMFVGFAVANSETKIEGKSTNNFEITAVANALMQSQRQASAFFPAVGMANGSMVSVGKATVVFPAYQIMNAHFLSNGASLAAFKVSAVKASRLSSNGQGMFNAKGGANANAIVGFAGNTLIDFVGTTAVITQFNTNGLSAVLFKPGSAVTKSMPRAYDIVVRPMEIRSVVWR